MQEASSRVIITSIASITVLPHHRVWAQAPLFLYDYFSLFPHAAWRPKRSDNPPWLKEPLVGKDSMPVTTPLVGGSQATGLIGQAAGMFQKVSLVRFLSFLGC
jgi:hypothetical protein